jgi:hypothetical protein
VVERPEVQLRDDRRDLHGDVVDVVAFEDGDRRLQSPGRFPVAEHGFAEEVHVQFVAFRSDTARCRVSRSGSASAIR